MAECATSTTEAEKPPRIGYVVKRFPRLSETFILNELRILKALGLEVRVFSLLAPEAEQQKGLLDDLDLEVHYLPHREAVAALPVVRRNYGRGISHEWTLRKVLKQGTSTPPYPGKRFSQCAALQIQGATLAAIAQSLDIEHFHAHFASDAATVATIASRVSGIPFSITAHAKDIYHTYSNPEQDQAFLAQKLAEARFTVTVSEYNRRHLQRLVGETATIHRLYNGVDLQRLPFHETPRENRLLVGVGRLVEKKGFIHLVEACARLRQRKRDFRCVILGEGPERPRLERRISELQLEKQVILVGALPQEQVFHWLRKAAAFVLPCIIGRTGDRDGLPTVILECMALGTPVISTRLAGIPEMIEHGESGWLVEPGSNEALADCLDHVLGLSTEARRTVARRARQRAEARFDLRHNVERLHTLFTEAVRERRKPVMEAE